MILPQTYFQSLILLILSLLLLGSWPIFFKLTRRWRFEMFYLDFALGAAVAAAIYVFTVGSLGFDGFSFLDDLMHAGKRQWLLAFGAGVAFNLGNMLLVGAISVAGMSVAVPVGVGLSLILAVGLPELIRRDGNPVFLFAGLTLMIGVIVCAALTHSAQVAVIAHAQVREAKAAHRKLVVVPSAIKGMLLSIVAGLLFSMTAPLFANSRASDLGLGPYSSLFLFVVGVFVSTQVFTIFFINLPVEGEPIELTAFFKGTLRDHLIGMLAGISWCTGTLAVMVVSSADPAVQVSRSLAAGLTYAAPLLSALWGMVVFKELRPFAPRARTTAILIPVLLAAAVALVSLANMFIKVQ